MPKNVSSPLAQTNYSNKTRRTVHTPIGHSVHNLLTTSVHNLMTLTVHEVLTLYTNYADRRYQLPRNDSHSKREFGLLVYNAVLGAEILLSLFHGIPCSWRWL